MRGWEASSCRKSSLWATCREGLPGQAESQLFTEEFASTLSWDGAGEVCGHSLCQGDRRTRAGRTPCPFCQFPCPVLMAGAAVTGAPPPPDLSSSSASPPTGVISEEGLRQEAPPILQHHILKVALELPASKFLWLKAQVGG